MLKLKPLSKNNLPNPPKLKKLIGPSFILLGLGLGSGEIILWPYLTSNFGMGIIWAAVLGITFQFFMNMEIERYSLINGESIFVGFFRKWRWLPIWFIFSTFAGFGWPGIIAASGKTLSTAMGIEYTKLIPIILLLLIGVILTLGPIIYKTEEYFQKYLIYLGVPFIFLLALLLSKGPDWSALGKGLLGIGDGYLFLPRDIPIASFLAAFAYAGAGGNLNLAQSFYVKEKGYGMGRYLGRITSILTGKEEDILITGTTFECNQKNLGLFKKWWGLVNIEHFAVFLLTGALTISMLGLLSFSTTFGKAGNLEGINFILNEALEIGRLTIPFIGTLFLLVASLMLFATQLTVMDASSRIAAENILLISNIKAKNLPNVFYVFLWAQIIFGATVFLFGFTQPLTLLILAAVINAFTMFVHIGLTLWVNKTLLDRRLRPSMVRQLAMVTAFLFFGFFSAFTLLDMIG